MDNFSIFDDVLELIGKEQEDLLAAEAKVATKVTSPDRDTSEHKPETEERTADGGIVAAFPRLSRPY